VLGVVATVIDGILYVVSQVEPIVDLEVIGEALLFVDELIYLQKKKRK